MHFSPPPPRIGNPEFNLAQGAFRSGKYKYMANVWCTGWYSFDRGVHAVDPLTNLTSVCDDNPCSDCWLFDLEADPREENNLISVYPEVFRNVCMWMSGCGVVARWLFAALLSTNDVNTVGCSAVVPSPPVLPFRLPSNFNA